MIRFDLFVPLIVLLTVWTLWITLVLITNIFDGLINLGILPEDWVFASGNYALIEKATAKYQPPRWLNRLLFFGAVVWQMIIAVLMWTAVISSFIAGAITLESVRAAFATSFGLFGAFLVADEICGDYRGEREHMLVLTGQAITFLLLEVLGR